MTVSVGKFPLLFDAWEWLNIPFHLLRNIHRIISECRLCRRCGDICKFVCRLRFLGVAVVVAAFLCLWLLFLFSYGVSVLMVPSCAKNSGLKQQTTHTLTLPHCHRPIWPFYFYLTAVHINLNSAINQMKNKVKNWAKMKTIGEDTKNTQIHFQIEICCCWCRLAVFSVLRRGTNKFCLIWWFLSFFFGCYHCTVQWQRLDVRGTPQSPTLFMPHLITMGLWDDDVDDDDDFDQSGSVVREDGDDD